MERDEIDAVCRLCLSENVNIIYVFESKGIPGWTAADGIRELLRIAVSEDDIYPRSVCIDCMRKLEDFKLFKERCENSKDLLDRAFAGKRGVGCDEIQESEDLIPKMISFGPGKVITPDHIPLLQPKIESDLNTPCTMTGGDSQIASKDEMELQEEEERDPLGDPTDVKPSVSLLYGALSAVKEELCGEGSTHELAGEVVTLSRLPGSVDIAEVKEECCNPSGSHNLDISTSESRSTNKGTPIASMARWISPRDRHARESRLKATGEPSGFAETYRPEWPHFQAPNFMKPCIRQKRTHTDLVENDAVNEAETKEINQSTLKAEAAPPNPYHNTAPSIILNSVVASTSSSVISAPSAPSPFIPLSCAPPQRPFTPSSFMERNIKNSKTLQGINKKWRHLRDSKGKLLAPEVKDPVYNLAMSVYSALKSLKNPRTAFQFRKKIREIINEIEESQLDELKKWRII